MLMISPRPTSPISIVFTPIAAFGQFELGSGRLVAMVAGAHTSGGGHMCFIEAVVQEAIQQLRLARAGRPRH